MNGGAGSPGQRLRVAIAAHGSERIAELTELLMSLGHVVVASDDPADVMLADREHPADYELPPARRHPTVVLGGTGSNANAEPNAESNGNIEGILAGDAGPAEIDAALHAVARGLLVRSRARLPAARSAGFGAAQEPDARSLLTPREAQVLDAIADGQTNKAIARHLGISLHTVKFHVESVLRKLGASTRAEAVAKAVERRREETIDL